MNPGCRAFVIAADGTAEPCPNYGREYRKPIDFDPARGFRAACYSRRERRALARHGTRGRRGARCVPKLRPMIPDVARVIRMVGHPLSDGRAEVLLYLPDGVGVTRGHARAVERALRS